MELNDKFWCYLYSLTNRILTCFVTDTLGILMIFISGYRHISVVIFWIKDTVRGYGKSWWDFHKILDDIFLLFMIKVVNPIPLRTILLIILDADEAVYHERHNITTLTALLKPFFFGVSNFLLIFELI